MLEIAQKSTEALATGLSTGIFLLIADYAYRADKQRLTDVCLIV